METFLIKDLTSQNQVIIEFKHNIISITPTIKNNGFNPYKLIRNYITHSDEDVTSESLLQYIMNYIDYCDIDLNITIERIPLSLEEFFTPYQKPGVIDINTTLH